MSFDMMDEFKSQFWNKWFQEPVPALEDMSPTEAVKTERGRKLLDKLLGYYESMSGAGRVGNLDVNILPKYAKWKLGYGPGSADEFAQEEAIMNFNADTTSRRRGTDCKERRTKKLEKKKAAIFIPKRCEVVGCEKRGDDVKACSRRYCAYYCGRDHQSQD